MSETLLAHRHTGAPGDPRMTEVADRVFAYIQPDGGWCLNNAGLLVGSEQVAVIDTAATEARARALRKAVGEVTDTPPRVVVNTHFHGDHTFGNAVLAGSDAVIIAHEQMRVEAAAAGLGLTGLWPDVGWGDISLTLPQLTFRDRITLHLGSHRAELIHFGPAHTTNDVVVWLPQERVLFAGDLLMPGCTPFVLMGSVTGSLHTIDQLRALGPRTVVGGHGPVSGPEVLDQTAAYLRHVQQLAGEGLAAGLTPLQTAREAGPGPFAGWLDAERLVGNLHRAQAEALGADPGEPLDVVGVFGEMVEYNDGRLPTCHA